jgi:hypothetical protein
MLSRNGIQPFRCRPHILRTEIPVSLDAARFVSEPDLKSAAV